ncbi:MAG: hypothetical protein OEM67_05615, partial [Thermoleophilia bacterium]|nr:hypothetical protein [Thermoleophilia bacterium]
MRRFSLLLVSLMLTLALVVAACDDDDDSATTSAEEAFCADADSLQAGVSALADLDVVAEGTNGIESAVSDVETDLQNLKESGTEVGGDELDALESSVQDLEDALSAAGEDLTTE